RGKDSGRADDQNEEIIRNRVKEYTVKTAPLKEYYLKQGKLRIVKGEGGIEAIFQKLCKEVDNG
ncbi:MAG TPA: adenylate kinase, partial [Bacteroidia bacterium]